MTDFRNKYGITIQKMAAVCQCSPGLLYGIEELGEITHPHIASRIAAAYGLDLDGYNDLVHKDHRSNKLPKPVEPPHNCSNIYKELRWR